MSLSDFAVKRPVTIRMFVAGVLLFGMISLSRLPRDLFPAVEYPQITVVTEYKGASPEEVETLITRIVEESVGTVSGVRRIRSLSREARSLVMVECGWGTNMDIASMAVREKIDLIKDRLPQGCGEPLVMRYNPFDLPVIVLNVTGEHSLSDLSQIARRHLKNEMEKIPGVASCALSGAARKEVKVDVDAGRLGVSDLSIMDVVEAVRAANLNYPAGTIDEAFYEQVIRTVGEFDDVAEIRTVPVFIDELAQRRVNRPYVDNAVRGVDDPAPTLEGDKEFRKLTAPSRRMVMVGDIADVYEGVQDKRAFARYNGADTVTLSIHKQAGANTVAVAEAVKDRLKKLRRLLPAGVGVNVTYDQSLFIRDAISGVTAAAVQGGLLAFLVLFFFLRNARSAAIVAASIPVSVAVAFTAMYFAGITMNMISLGGLALGIGMLVDNAIVVMENVTRLRRQGLPAGEAAARGAGEVAGALVSSTLTTVIVFLPMVFVSGVAGQLFKELAFTVIVSLAASLVVALTVIPSLAAVLPAAEGSTVDLLAGAGQRYEAVLTRLLGQRPAATLVPVVLAFIVALLAAGLLEREFMPGVDRGQFAVEYSLVPGTSLARTEAVAAGLERFLLADPSVESVIAAGGAENDRDAGNALTILGQHQGRLLVNLKPRRPWWSLVDFTGAWRHVSSRRLVERTKEFARKQDFAGADFKYLVSDNIFQAAFAQEAPIAVQIKGYDLEYLADVAGRIELELARIAGVSGIRNSLVQASPENRIDIDKDKAAVMGLSVSDIALLTQTAIDGKTAGTWKHEGREYDIRVRLRPQDRDDLDAIRRLLLRSASGYEVMLADVATIDPGRGPTEIRHEDQQRTVTVWAQPGEQSPDRIAKMIEKRIVPRLNIKPDYAVSVAGEAVAMRESIAGLLFALLLSLILVYMVMAGQFEHFTQPLIIMGTIPLAVIGVVAGLVLTGTRISVMAVLGMIVLGGIAVNNGIVLIDYINRLRSEGMNLLPAVVQAARTRLQPIVMTATTTILGLLPLAIGISDGARLQRPMAITVITGLLASTFLSLVVVPVLYYLTTEKSEK